MLGEAFSSAKNPGIPKTIVLTVFPLKDHYSTKDFQLTNPGDSYFSGQIIATSHDLFPPNAGEK